MPLQFVLSDEKSGGATATIIVRYCLKCGVAMESVLFQLYFILSLCFCEISGLSLSQPRKGLVIFEEGPLPLWDSVRNRSIQMILIYICLTESRITRYGLICLCTGSMIEPSERPLSKISIETAAMLSRGCDTVVISSIRVHSTSS